MKWQEYDTSRHQAHRQILVKEIEEKGISDPEVLNAIGKVPRHLFVTREQEDLAYVDKALPIERGQTISQPYTVAYQTQLLEVKPGDKVLEIGTGSAYQASVLAQIGADVYTIERQRRLFNKYKDFEYLREFPNIHFFYGDGYEGLPQFAPFDKILITAASNVIPEALINQLRPHGCLVMPLGTPPLTQQMIRIVKTGNGKLIKEFFDHFSFVPMLEGKED